MDPQVYRIAAIPGDGIGPEVMAVGLTLLRRVSELGGPGFLVTELPWGSAYFLGHGQVMPDDGLQTLGTVDAILLGALGDPRVSDRETVRGLVIRIRQAFQQYVNLRPVRRLDGKLDTVDLVVVRENSEGEYAGVGGRVHVGSDGEAAMEVTYMSRRAVLRVARFAFELARRRRRQLTSITKSNALVHVMALWDDVVAEVSRDYPDVAVRSALADSAALDLVLHPERFDVLVASNLLGDILSDVAAGAAGGLGMAPSANLNPEGRFPSMFEPVHGSAPDIAGRGVANPLAMALSIGLMLDQLGEAFWAAGIVRAVEAVAKTGPRTPDQQGAATTADVEAALVDALARQAGRGADDAVPGMG